MGVTMAMTATLAEAGAREQAKRMYDRIAGVPATDAELDAMLAIMDANDDNITDSDADAKAAA